jgi:GNAT superfamily N-acetyltransferase
VYNIDAGTDERRRRHVHQRLRETNSLRSPVMRELRGTRADTEAPLHVYAVEGGRVVGGLIALTWAYWLHINLLWVEENRRGCGLGSRLMAEAERLAVERDGCRHARVETFDFQAPAFYQKLGYELVGSVTDYPPGCTDHILVKPLPAAAR